MIDFQQVTKFFGAQPILVEASFRVNSGEQAGMVGPNGAGKSTVFGLITGECAADGGSVTLPGHARLGHVRQQLVPHREHGSLLQYVQRGVADMARIQAEMHDLQERLGGLSGSEREQALERLGACQTRFESLGGYDLKHRASAALGGLGFAGDDADRPFASFSGGWQMRAELARVLVADPDILLLDEPSNYLDLPAVEWLRRYLREFRGTLLLISHDRYLLNSLTTLTVEVANAETTRYAGGYDAYVEQRRRRTEQSVAARKNQERRRQQIERYVARFRAKARLASQVQSKLRMLERMEEIKIPGGLVSPGRIRLRAPARSGREVIRLDDAGLTYDGRRWILRHVDLALERGDKTALVGLNGTGKTTLLRLLAGTLPLSEGRRRVGHKVAPGYQSQEFAETMSPRQTVFETVKARAGQASEQQVRTLLGGFGFSGSAIDKPVEVLSGGEKVRLAFARLLADPPNFLILDEPTTHLDVAAREALEQALAGFEGTLCMVSHDVAFVRAVATSVLAMAPPGVRRYAGGYDYYRHKLAAEEAAREAPAAAAAVGKQVSDRKLAKRRRAELVQRYSKRRRALRRDLAREEQRVAALESEQAGILAELSSGRPNLEYGALNRRLAALQQKINDANRRWEAFAVALDEAESDYRRQVASDGTDTSSGR